MKHPHRPRRSRAGYTLVELAIAAFLMASLLFVAGMATDRCMSMFRQRRAAQAVSASAARVVQRVAGELTAARRGSLQPGTLTTQGSSSIQFQKCLGVSAGAVQWSTVFTLRWELDAGEDDDGTDDDHDGLVDEGQLVLVQDAGLPAEQRTVLAHGLCEFLPGESFNGNDDDADGLIDERGLCFSLAGDVLTIRLGLQGRGLDGATLTKVVETSVYVRN